MGGQFSTAIELAVHTGMTSSQLTTEGRSPRGRYFRHLTAMAGGNAGNVGNIFRPWRKNLASTFP